MAQQHEMTRRAGKKTGKLPYEEYTDGKAVKMADNVELSRQHSTADAIKRNAQRPKKRRQKEATQVQQDNFLSFPPAKKARIEHIPNQDATFGEATPSRDTQGAHAIVQADHTEIGLQIPSVLMTKLVAIYKVHNMKIISSSKIQAKVTTIVERLGSFSFVAATKPNIVLIHAKGPVSSKLVSIVEIAKREIARTGGKWYQYNFLGQTFTTQEKKSTSIESTGFAVGHKTDAESNAMEVDYDKDKQSNDEDENAFETMKTPLERAIEGRPRVQAIPIIAIFLSRVRINTLKEAYGEQTNALT